MKSIKLSILAVLAFALSACGNGIASKEDAAKALQRVMDSGNSTQSSAKSGLTQNLSIDTTATVQGEEGEATVTVKVNIAEGNEANMTIVADIVYKEFKAQGDENTYDGTEKLEMTVKASGLGDTFQGEMSNKVVADMTMSGEFDSTFKCDVTVKIDAAAMSATTGTASMTINGYVEADGTRYDYANEAVTFDAAVE